MVKRKRNVKKKTPEIEITPELVVEPKDPDALPIFSEEYDSWSKAAIKFKLETGRTSTNIFEFIDNMGKNISIRQKSQVRRGSSHQRRF